MKQGWNEVYDTSLAQAIKHARRKGYRVNPNYTYVVTPANQAHGVGCYKLFLRK